MKHSLEIVESSSGTAIYLNDYRISGDKPAYDAKVSKQSFVDDKDLTIARGHYEKPRQIIKTKKTVIHAEKPR